MSFVRHIPTYCPRKMHLSQDDLIVKVYVGDRLYYGEIRELVDGDWVGVHVPHLNESNGKNTSGVYLELKKSGNTQTFVGTYQGEDVLVHGVPVLYTEYTVSRKPEKR